MSDANNPFAAWLPPFLNPAALNPFVGLAGTPPGTTPDVSQWMKALDPAEIEKRIQELRVVELWLQSQVNMVQMSIQGLTLQKQSMEALKSAGATASATSAALSAGVTKKRRASSTKR
jgi:hypothetical protein